MAAKKKKVLDIYIDESGDFGVKKSCSDLYVVSMVMFDNCNNIKKELSYLEKKLDKLGFIGIY